MRARTRILAGWTRACTHILATSPPIHPKPNAYPTRCTPPFAVSAAATRAPPPSETGARTVKVPLEIVWLAGPEPDFRGPNLRCTTNPAVCLQMSKVASPSLSFPIGRMTRVSDVTRGVSMLLCTLVVTSLATPRETSLAQPTPCRPPPKAVGRLERHSAPGRVTFKSERHPHGGGGGLHATHGVFPI